jgi:hypothetical protein
MTFTWWIDEPVLKGSSNPKDEDLAELRAQGFATAVSMLEKTSSRRSITGRQHCPRAGRFIPFPFPKIRLPRLNNSPVHKPAPSNAAWDEGSRFL